MHAGDPPVPLLEPPTPVPPAPPSPLLDAPEADEEVLDWPIATPSPPLHADNKTPRSKNVEVRMCRAYATQAKVDHRFRGCSIDATSLWRRNQSGEWFVY